MIEEMPSTFYLYEHFSGWDESNFENRTSLFLDISQVAFNVSLKKRHTLEDSDNRFLLGTLKTMSTHNTFVICIVINFRSSRSSSRW